MKNIIFEVKTVVTTFWGIFVANFLFRHLVTLDSSDAQNYLSPTRSSALFMAHQFVSGGVADCVLALGFEKMQRGSLSSVFDDRTNPLDKVRPRSYKNILIISLRYADFKHSDWLLKTFKHSDWLLKTFKPF